MSITLCYVCTMEVGRGPAYWWPLLYEVLRDHDFRFGDPALPGKVSVELIRFWRILEKKGDCIRGEAKSFLFFSPVGWGLAMSGITCSARARMEREERKDENN